MVIACAGGPPVSPRCSLPNLLQRQFTVTRPNKAWVTDITYIRTWQGWLYVAVVMDLFSRKVVGWAAGPSIARELVLDAVLMAVRRRPPRGTVTHSDQGTHTAAMHGVASVALTTSSRV